MANIKSIGGNPIVLGIDGLTDDAKQALGSSVVAGGAEALLGADSTAQWVQRTTTGSGAATVRSVQGAAVGWNQYTKMVNRTTTSKGITFTAQDGKATFDAPNGAEGTESFYMDLNNIYMPIAGHKYIAYGTNESETIIFSHSHMGTLRNTVFTTQATQAGQFNLRVSADFTGTYECYPMLFDLTQMFGSGNEPSTVAEFEAMYPESYYPYSAPTLKPARIAGIASTDAQGGELDAIEWTAQELWGAGAISDMLYSDRKVTKMATLDMGTLTWQKHATKTGTFYASMVGTGGKGVYGTAEIPNCRCIPYTAASYNDVMGSTQFDNVYNYESTTNYLYLKDASKDSVTAAEFKASLSGVTLVYELAEPTTTPISPALPMTYKVEQGGSESIIVPDGEVCAAPIITVAEGESAAELVMDALACIAAPDGPVATANHAINTYLTMGGKLYKVTTAIASGEQIVSGTNVTETTVMAELLALAN